MMTQPSPRRRLSTSLPLLLSSCATGLALAALPVGLARAQAFQGTGTFAAGTGSIVAAGTPTAPVTNVTITSPTAVINWTPTDTDPVNPAAIDFLPANGRANFDATNNYTVLNRILTPTSRPIGLNGQVFGTVTPVSGASQVGGDVWFYSPTGIIAGSGSSFSANGLIFTANDIPFTPGAGGGLTVGPSAAIQFTAAADSQAAVVIQPGATIITATGGSSYVALVAPRVDQGGSITVDGSVALVAAEQATLTINQGLFDIRLFTGTTVTNAVTTSGQTGIAPTGFAVDGAQKVYVAALPKNTAITMLLGGTFGTSAASAASTANRAVVLSGGYDIFEASGGTISTFASNSPLPANIQIGTSDFASALTVAASGTITASPSPGTTIHFEDNASFISELGITLTADLDEQILADKDLSLFSPVSAAIVLGTAGVGNNPAVLNVGGNLTIDTSNTAFVDSGSATGGFSSLEIAGGAVGPSVTIGGTLKIMANGTGAPGSGAGGDGTGGIAQILIGGGTLTANDVILQAIGAGGSDTDTGSGTSFAGTGLGGTAQLVATGGTTTLTQLSIDASGVGGFADFADGGLPTGGAGRGGEARLTLGSADFTIVGSTPSADLSANGTGGAGEPGGTTPGGSGTGGTAAFAATDTLNYALGDLTLHADGQAGDSSGPPSPFDGTGIGGTASFVNQGTGPADSRTVGALTLSANGNPGAVSGGFGTNGVGGFVQVSDLASGANGRVQAGSIFAQASGFSPPPSGKGALLESAGGPLAVANYINIDAAGTISVAVTGDATIGASSFVSLSSAFGDIAITHTGQTQPATPTILADSLFVDAGNNVSAGTGTLLSGISSISVVARNGDIDVDSLMAGQTLDVHALHNVLLTNATTTGTGVSVMSFASSGGGIDITAGIDPVEFQGGYQPFDIVVRGTVSALGQLTAHAGRDIIGLGASRLEGQSVLLVGERDISGANLSIASQSDLNLFVGRNLLVGGTVDVAGTINMFDALEQPVQTGILSVPGALAIGNLILRGPTAGLLRAGGDLSIGTAQTTGLDVASTGGALTVGGLTGFPTGPSAFLTASAPSIALAGITVSGDVTATATGTLTINGPVSGTTIRASSGDIVIAPGASLGSAGKTTLLELTNGNAARRSFFGGADNTTGYSLSGAEIAQLFGDTITLIAPLTAQSSAASPDVTVGALTVTSRAGNASGQLGAQGAFTIQTNGRVAVNGAVRLTGAGAGNSFVIRAGELIAIDNQTGLIDLRGASNGLAGAIDLSANTIMAASISAQQAVAGTTDIAAINARLGARDGAVNEQGVLRADAIRLAVTNGLYIQNTGGNVAASLRRGFTVGAGGLAVSTRSASARIVINGQATDTAGGIATGLGTIPLVRINGQPAPSSSGSAAGSTINGCIFTNVAACPNAPAALPSEVVPTRDRVQGSVDPPSQRPLDQPLTVPSIQLDSIGRFDYEPLIDEPVTGSGNDDLWVPECNQGKAGGCSTGP